MEARQQGRTRQRWLRWVTAAVAVACLAGAAVSIGFGGRGDRARSASSGSGGADSAPRGVTGLAVDDTTSGGPAPSPGARALAGAGKAADPDARPDRADGLGGTTPRSPHEGPTAGLDPHVVIPADSTPAAAAAGLEPGSMSPLAGIPNGWSSYVHRFTLNRLVRSYLLVRPTRRSSAPLPVMVVLHGRGSTPAGIERATGLVEATGPAIQVYPAGYGRSWNAGGCCGQAHAANIDDQAFITDVVRQVLASQPDASANSVYLVGFSNGGRLAYRLACSQSGRWAGAAVVEAVPASTCQTTTPVPLVVVANTHDPFFNVGGDGPPKVIQGYVEATVQTTVEAWRNLDGCSATQATHRLGAMTADLWSSCRGRGRVSYALYNGSGHHWPRGDRVTPSATDLIWALLRGGHLPAATT